MDYHHLIKLATLKRGLSSLQVRGCSAATVALGCLLAAAAMAGAAEPGRLLEEGERRDFLQQLETVQGRLRTFQAAFSEQRTLSTIARPLYFEGRLYYERGRLFFMAYEKPLESVLQVKGQEALLYVAGSPAADVVDLAQLDGMPRHTELFAWQAEDFQGAIYVLEDSYRLVPQASGGAGRRLTIWLDRCSLLMRGLRIEEGSGDTTTLTLTEVRTNEALPQAVRNFVLPPGVKRNRLDRQ
jgi:outer membrane lipoprotein-sorting protein